jgi:nascent polypeptide-associated complex subunit alpha
MKKQGIEGMDMIEAKRVIIETEDKLLVFRQPQVVAVSQSGVTAYQVIGEPEEMEPGSIALGEDEESFDDPIEEGSADATPLAVTIKPEDIDLVSMQANVSKDVAEKELKATNGDLAKAIINLMNR